MSRNARQNLSLHPNFHTKPILTCPTAQRTQASNLLYRQGSVLYDLFFVYRFLVSCNYALAASGYMGSLVDRYVDGFYEASLQIYRTGS